MTPERWQYPWWLGIHRRAFEAEPERALIPFVRALNSVALDELTTTGPNRYFDEAESALEAVISNDGATPSRVHHLVMILINDGQANAFSGGPGWPDQGRSLDAAQRAVNWVQELLGQMAGQGEAVPVDAHRNVASDAINAHLTLARVQAACALGEESHATFATALKHYKSDDFADEWGDLVRSVGQEVGVDAELCLGASPEGAPVATWYWYGTSGA